MRCYRCERDDLSPEDFPVDRSKASGRMSLCRGCDNTKSRGYYAANRERVLERVKANYRRKKEKQR